jgi:hypothetical protein
LTPNLEFKQKALAYWTDEKLKKLSNGSQYHLTPQNAPALLRALGLLNADASFSADSMRKYKQMNHLLNLLEKDFQELAKRFQPVHLWEVGCGKSYLSFVVAHYFKEVLKAPVRIFAFDANPQLIQSAQRVVDMAGLGEEIRLSHQSLMALTLKPDQWPQLVPEAFLEGSTTPRVHGLMGLHACDTLSCAALSLGLNLKADLLAMVPCCQAQLASQLKSKTPGTLSLGWSSLKEHPELRREMASQLTDLMRVQLLEGSGYEVVSTEFVSGFHSAKNRLIIGRRRAQFRDDALIKYQDLSKSLGDSDIYLRHHLPDWVDRRMAQTPKLEGLVEA